MIALPLESAKRGTKNQFRKQQLKHSKYMNLIKDFTLLALAALTLFCSTTGVRAAGDPLPSWNDGPSKKAILEFVTKVTASRSPDFLPVEERIATFDNDGTLWVE